MFFPYRGAVARVNPEERLTRAAGSYPWVQIHSDVANVPISLTRVGDAPALGSAILTALEAGIYSDVR